MRLKTIGMQYEGEGRDEAIDTALRNIAMHRAMTLTAQYRIHNSPTFTQNGHMQRSRSGNLAPALFLTSHETQKGYGAYQFSGVPYGVHFGTTMAT
jgi:hypothetical protein